MHTVECGQSQNNIHGFLGCVYSMCVIWNLSGLHMESLIVVERIVDDSQHYGLQRMTSMSFLGSAECVMVKLTWTIYT